MWKRRDLKAPARSNLKRRYWLIVFICFLMAFAAGEYGTTTTLSRSYGDAFVNVGTTAKHHARRLNTENLGIFGVLINNTATGQKLKKSYEKPTKGVLAGMADSLQSGSHGLTGILNTINKFSGDNETSAGFIALGGLILYLFFVIFIKNILIVGERRWFLENRIYHEASILRLLFVYRDRCVKHVGWVMLVKTVKEFLWMLTIVGGIIKYFEYKAIPYILAENPDMATKDVFKLARGMMKGYKWKLFILYLSFWYWLMLSTFTAGLVRIFFLNGYMRGTEAEFFVRVRHEAIINAVDCADQLQDAVLYVSPEDGITRYPGIVRKELKNPLVVDFHRKYSLINLILMFFMFSFFGWVWEVSLHLMNDGVFVNRGTMYGPWLPIYGTGGIMVLVLLRRFRNNPPLTFILTMIICGIVEYATSWYLQWANGERWWDYSGYLLNLNGRICLEGLLVFAIGGTIFIYIIAPLNDAMLNKLPVKVRVTAMIILLACFGVDAAYSHFVPNSGKGITDYKTTSSVIKYRLAAHGYSAPSAEYHTFTANAAGIKRLN